MSLLFKSKSDKRKLKYLSTEYVGNCCGAGWICNWPSLSIYWDEKERVKVRADVEKDLDTILEKMFSISMIVLTHKQKAIWNDLILSKGFKIAVNDKYHTYAGNLLTLYTKARFRKTRSGNWIDVTGNDGEGPNSEWADEDF